MSREVDPNDIKSAEDFVYLAQRNQLPQAWIDANGGDDGVGEIMRGERKPKKPKGLKSGDVEASTESAATPEQLEEVEEQEAEAAPEEEEEEAKPARSSRSR